MMDKYLCLSCEKTMQEKAKEEGAEYPERFVTGFFITFDNYKAKAEGNPAYFVGRIVPNCSYCLNPINTEDFTEDEFNAAYINGDISKETFDDITNAPEVEQ